MGVSMTVPTRNYTIAANGESPVQEKELWFIPDNGVLFNYAAKTNGPTGNLTLHDGDETVGADAATTSGTAFNSIWSNATNANNGTDAHDVRLTSSVACTCTIGADTQGHTTGGVGVPYARVTVWTGAANAKHPLSDQSGRVWPRGVRAWKGTGVGDVQH